MTSTLMTGLSKFTMKYFSTKPVDVALGLVGVGMAAGSAALPFYIHANGGSFGPPRMEFTGQQDAQQLANERGPFEFDLEKLKVLGIDPVATGSLSPAQGVKIKPRKMERKLNPVSERPVIIGATHGRAIVLDHGVVGVVRPNSRLSDGSKVRSIRQTATGWEIITSYNERIRWQSERK